MAAAAVSIDPSLYHHSQHHFSPYSHPQHSQHQHLHSSSHSSPSAASVASLASALGVANGGAGHSLTGLLSSMNAHTASVNAMAAFRNQQAAPMHVSAVGQQHHNTGGFPNFSTGATNQSSFVPLFPPLYPMAQAAAVPLAQSTSSLTLTSSNPNFSVYPVAGNATSMSAWPPTTTASSSTSSFHSSPHLSRVLTPDSSPSTPTHFQTNTSGWAERLMPLNAHTFSMQHSGPHDDYPMQAAKDDVSAHDLMSEHSGGGGADKDDSSASSPHLLMSRSAHITRQLSSHGREQAANRRRSSSNTSAASGGSSVDDKQLEALLRTIRLSVAKMDELITTQSPPAGSSTASTASTASSSSTASSPSTSPALRPSRTAALEDIKALLVSAANSVASKKRKSVDESADGTEVGLKRRITAGDDEDDEGGDEAGDGAYGVQEMSGGGVAEEDDDEEEGAGADDDDSPRTQCKPCPLVESINKKPLKVLYVNVQRQYTVSKKETVRMGKEDKERLVPVHVRIMGTPARGELYFVAKDVCLLIHTRKGNVAKSIGQFREDEKVRMSVVCPRSNGTVSTHILTALTVKGVKRLLTTSRSPLASHVLKWIMKQVDVIMAEHAEERKQRQMRRVAAAAAAAQQQQQKDAAAAATTPLPVRKISQDSAASHNSFGSNKSSPFASPASSSGMGAPVVPLAPLSPPAVSSAAPFGTQEPSAIVKPSPLNYRLSPSSTTASASQQLSVMVGQQQALSQSDSKAGSLPSSPTRATSLPTSLLPSAPSTPDSAARSNATSPSPTTASRSAFSKVQSVGSLDADGKRAESAAEGGRVSPSGEKAADGAAGGAVPGKSNAKLTSLLQAIKNVDTK